MEVVVMKVLRGTSPFALGLFGQVGSTLSFFFPQSSPRHHLKKTFINSNIIFVPFTFYVFIIFKTTILIYIFNKYFKTIIEIKIRSKREEHE